MTRDAAIAIPGRTPPHKDRPISLPQEADITLAEVTDFPALGQRWRALEGRSKASFFQSWSWVGCRAEHRFPNPTLLTARSQGQDVALALFNRNRPAPLSLSPKTLWLGESGISQFDSIYVEHNGVLLAPNQPGLLDHCLRHVLAAGGATRLVLSGVDDAHLQAARATGAALRVTRSQNAPYVDLAALQTDFLDTLSAGTRYQLRRSARKLAARGNLRMHRAGDVAEAHNVLADLARLHQATWTARGQPGAFANPEFQRFHHALIAEALPRGEIDLLRITAGPTLIGCLYNFRHRGHVLAYQSGFDHAASRPHEKPGLTCHHLAIAAAREDGMTRYDFLAGEDRYKSSLAPHATKLHWLDLAPRWSLQGLAMRAKNGLKSILGA